MIPKIIHYCWFGGNEKSELINNCILSWRKYCPEYEIVEWNENNWDITKYQYAENAFKAKKWAFVSDVARLDIIYNYGGIYLDTDVEILVNCPFDEFLEYDNILAFENSRNIASGLFFAAKPYSDIVKKMLQSYIDTQFTIDSFVVNTKMNKPVFIRCFPKLKWNGKTQGLGSTYIMGCEDYGKLMKHYGTRSWADNLPEYTISGSNIIKTVMRNPRIFELLEKNRIGRMLLPVYTFLAYDLQDLGVIYFIKLNINKNKLRHRNSSDPS